MRNALDMSSPYQSFSQESNVDLTLCYIHERKSFCLNDQPDG